MSYRSRRSPGIFSFPVELQILFYAVAGPRLVVTPALSLNADTKANPWLKVTAPLKVEVFFDLDIKVKTFTVGGTVYDNTFPVYSSPGAFPVPYLSGGTKAASPAVVSKPLNPASITPIQYAINWPANCDPAEAVTWSMAPGSLGTVSSTGLYTPPNPLPGFDFDDLIDATTAGSTNCPPVTAQAAVHFGGSTAESPTSAAISPDGTTVTWTAPADNGGSPIQEYIVTVLGDPSDPAGADTVLGTVPGSVTSLAIPADRIPQVEEDNAKVAVTAVNDRGQSRPSDDSPVAPATDPMTTMTATAQGTAGAGTITVTPSLLNLGEADATDVTFQLTYPAVFTSPTLPSYCTNNTATDVITCDPGAIASGAYLPTPIQFSLGQMTVGTGYPVTVTRTSASPYPSDPDNGTATLSCVADATLTVTCH